MLLVSGTHIHVCDRYHDVICCARAPLAGVLDGKTKAEASALGAGRKVEVKFFMAGVRLLPSAAHLI